MINVAVPLYGKMAARAFHSPVFRGAAAQTGLSPIFYVSREALKGLDKLDVDKYEELRVSKHEEIYRKSRMARFCVSARHFAARTATTDLRFREAIDAWIFRRRPVAHALAAATVMDGVRHLPGAGRLLIILESKLVQNDLYGESFRKHKISCVLTPAMGGMGFLQEAMVAREAKRVGVKVISAISNYDNIVNKGFPGFWADKLAVWSRDMADDAMRYFGYPAAKIEITGPVPFDQYFRPLPIDRDSFLMNKGLDSSKPTVLYMGGVNVTRYFEFLSYFRRRVSVNDKLPYNVIFRIAPHAKIMVSPAMETFLEMARKFQWLYISNPLETSPEVMQEFVEGVLKSHEEYDELHCLFKFSDVMINHYSTASLEASIFDLPSIFVGYDSYTFEHRYAFFSEFHQRQAHNLKKIRQQASAKAENEEDLSYWIEKYLEDRSVHKEERSKYALQECCFLDGRSGLRLCNLIRGMVG